MLVRVPITDFLNADAVEAVEPSVPRTAHQDTRSVFRGIASGHSGGYVIACADTVRRSADDSCLHLVADCHAALTVPHHPGTVPPGKPVGPLSGPGSKLFGLYRDTATIPRGQVR